MNTQIHKKLHIENMLKVKHWSRMSKRIRNVQWELKLCNSFKMLPGHW